MTSAVRWIANTRFGLQPARRLHVLFSVRRPQVVMLGLAALACTPPPARAPTSMPKADAPKPPGTLYQDTALHDYVEARAACLTREAGVDPMLFVLDEATVGAWALPGNGIAVTRGLLVFLRSEAELEAVLAHEVAHLELGHAKDLEDEEEDNAPSSVFELPGLVVDAAREAAHSRADERAADQRSIELLERCGRTALATGELFAALEPLEDDEGRTFFASHPATKERRHAALARVGPTRPDPGRVAYLQAIDGMLLGEDAREGYVQDRAFVVPRRNVLAQLPYGWTTEVSDGVLLLEQPEFGGLVIFAPIDVDDPAGVIPGFVEDAEVEHTGVETTDVSGLTVTSTTFSYGDKAAILACLYRDGIALLVFAVGNPDTWEPFAQSVTMLMTGIGSIEDPAQRAVEPLRVHALELQRAATLAEVAERDDCDLNASDLARLNGVSEGARLPAGTVVKIGRGFSTR